MCKIEKSGRTRTSGEGVVLEIRTHPDKGRGWFENPRFWRTSFVDGPLEFIQLLVPVYLSCHLPGCSVEKAIIGCNVKCVKFLVLNFMKLIC